jgi:hypothetical protein
VRLIEAGVGGQWDELMATHHYLGFRTLVGESLKYVAEQDGSWLALLDWGAAAFKCGPRDRWILLSAGGKSEIVTHGKVSQGGGAEAARRRSVTSTESCSSSARSVGQYRVAVRPRSGRSG